jgi:hypothetical protein
MSSLSMSSSSSSKWGRRTMQQQPSSSSSRHGSSRHHPTRKSLSNPAASAAVITDVDPSLSSTSSTLLLGRSLSSSYHSSSAHGVMIESIPEDHEVFSSSSTHSVGRSSKRSAALPAQSHRQRMDALDLSSSTSRPFVKGSGKGSRTTFIHSGSSRSNLSMTGRFHSAAAPPGRSISSSSFDIDTFHVGLNQCDAEALPKLRRLRESNPIVITEIDDNDDIVDGPANAKAAAAAGMLPYRALQVFPGASHWWYHPYYYPTSALMRGQS